MHAALPPKDDTVLVDHKPKLFSGEFVLTKPKIVMKPARRQYSVNESYSASWDPRVLAFVNSKKEGDHPIPQR